MLNQTSGATRTIWLASIFLSFSCISQAQTNQPGAAVVNLPVCAGSPVVDDTPGLFSVIQTSGMNTFYVSPKAPCYVHFTGTHSLPAGTTLQGTAGRSILRLFTGGGVRDNLMFITNPNITIDGLMIDADTPTLSGYQGALIFVANTYNFRFGHDAVMTSSPGGTRGIALWLYNTSAAIEGNDFTNYGTQLQITADPGRNPKIEVSGNHLHDNDASGGNAIYIASANGNKASLPVIADHNFIWNIKASSWSSGQNGNGVLAYLANNVQLNANDVESPRFSCFRSNSSDGFTATGNHCSGAGESGGFTEFAAQHNIWVDNVFENIAKTCLDLTNYDQGGQFHTAMGNHMIHCGGPAIQAEANTLVIGNTIDQCQQGVVMGYGAFGKNVVVKDNLITDTSGAHLTEYGIGIESGTSGGMEVEGNRIDLPKNEIVGTSFYQIANGGALPPVVTIRNQAVSFYQLGSAADGSMVYCPDCRVGPICGGGGAGAFAKRLQNTWRCQ